MNLTNLKNKLDDFFDITNISQDMPFSRVLPKIYDAANTEFRRYFTEGFLQTFHGLMLKNGEDIKKVYLTVFLSSEVLDKIFTEDVSDALIFSHHPMDMESSNRGFLPLEEKYFLELQRRRISVYCLHTPLDINKNISTSRSIARALNLQNWQEYDECSGGYAGICGTLEVEVPFAKFINSLHTVFVLKEIHSIQRFPNVYKIGIIAGGGADVQYMKETIAQGCDTYLSGDYLNKVKNEFSLQKRKEFEGVKDSLSLNLIECSHYATERLVIVNEVSDLFKKLGVEVVFIPQDNPWR
jgi:putative NIF3 family GTP cyclohydrolase 1 type 2